MSHFTRIKVKITNGDLLKEVLEEMGHSVEENVLVRGYEGDRTEADFVIRRPNGYDLGFRRDKDDQNYELIADFWGAKINQTQFVNEIQRKYAHRQLLETVAQQGYTIEEQEILDNGEVRVVVGRWV